MRNDRTLSRAQAFLTEVVVAGLNVPQVNILKNIGSLFTCAVLVKKQKQIS